TLRHGRGRIARPVPVTNGAGNSERPDPAEPEDQFPVREDLVCRKRLVGVQRRKRFAWLLWIVLIHPSANSQSYLPEPGERRHTAGKKQYRGGARGRPNRDRRGAGR